MLKVVLKHMFTRKAIEYRIGKAIITFAACWFWTGNVFKSVEVAVTVIICAYIWYGINDWRYHGRVKKI